MKLDRMIGILAILLQRDRVTAPYLAEKFEVSRRTINRDIERLCMAGLRSLDSVSGTRRYAQLMERLAPDGPGLLSGGPHILIDLSSWYKASLAPKIERIHQAIEESRLVSFSYHAPSGESDRVAEPYDLVFQWGGWYLWAWCRLREDFRLFKLNRMTGLELCGFFEKREAPLPDLSQEKVFPHTHQVKARIAPEYRWRLIEEYGADSFAVQADSSLLFTFDFADKETIIGWIASFGGGAELLEPAWLRQELVRFGENIRKKHLDT